MIGLTPRQLQLLTFIRAYMVEKGVAPSYAEMCEHLGLASKSGIHRMIAGLVERGHLRAMPYRTRALEVLSAPPPPPKPAGKARITILLKADGTLDRITRFGSVDVFVKRESA